MTHYHPDKGKFGGRCNRTACQDPGAVYYNYGTEKFYCAPCAIAINRTNSDVIDEMCRISERGENPFLNKPPVWK